MEEDIGKW